MGASGARFNAEEYALFIGAGASFGSGAPGFLALKDAFLSAALPHDQGGIPAGELKALTPEQIFERLDDGRPRQRAAIVGYLTDVLDRNVEPNLNHFVISGFLRAGTTVWTTNFDTLIERAATALRYSPTVLSPPSKPSHAASARLMKVHGSLAGGGSPVATQHSPIFALSEVWAGVATAWADALERDMKGKRVLVCGYRGEDIDVVPVLARAFRGADSVIWWELGDNVVNLRERFHAYANVSIVEGNPTDAFRAYAGGVLTRAEIALAPADRGSAWSPASYRGELSRLARGRLAGAVLPANRERRLLAEAVLLDPAENRRPALRRLMRSLAFDVPLVRAAVLPTTGAMTRTRVWRSSETVWGIYFASFDAEPVRPGDDARLDRLLVDVDSRSVRERIQLASKAKRLGRLRDARRLSEDALGALRSGSAVHPLLEAMAAYNLIWTLRQMGSDESTRRGTLETYRRNEGYIGANWAAWFALEAVLAALQRDELDEAEAVLDGVLLQMARERIRHPMFVVDENAVRAVAAWCRSGPTETVRRELAAIDDRFGPLSHGRRMSFGLVDVQLLLADWGRAAGDDTQLRNAVRVVRERSASRLQLRRADLIEVARFGTDEAILDLRVALERESFGALAAAADLVVSGRSGIGRVQLANPLTGIY